MSGRRCFHGGVEAPKTVGFATEVNGEARQAECQEPLRALFKLLQQYEAENGHLPKAAFYPCFPLAGEDSLRVLPGTKAVPTLTCPTCSPDLKRFGLNYAWNEKVSGRKLAEINDPANTWLLADFVGAHDWMTSNRYCGHRAVTSCDVRPLAYGIDETHGAPNAIGTATPNPGCSRSVRNASRALRNTVVSWDSKKRSR